MNIDSSINSAIEYIRSGNSRKAEAVCKKILRKQPDNIYALHLLGVISHQLGKHEAAVMHLKKALQIDPNFADAYSNLGNIYYERKQFDEAIRFFLKALRLKPNAKTWFNLGMLLQEREKLDEAITAYQQALSLNLRNAGIMNNLGLVFQKKGQFDKSMVYYRKALDIDPDYQEAYYNLGNLMQETNELDQAMAYYQKALQINPEYCEAYTNLGLTLQRKRLLNESEICFRKALRINPNLVEAYNNLGNVLKDTGRTDEAFKLYQKVLELDTLNAGAYNNLGALLKDKGQIEEAETYYRKALQLEPNSPVYYGNLLLLLNYSSHYSAQDIFAEHLRFARQIAEPLYPAAFHYPNDCSHTRRLKVGYVSPDFRRHSVNYFIEPVLSSHSHEQFEVFCYSDVRVPDNVTERLKGYADQWRNTAGISDEQVGELIRKDGIDILIDLAGQTGYNRMLLFARKPAPVQVNWLGYPNTTGLSTMDYRLVDGHTDPTGLTDPFYTEKLIRLPDSFLCYRPPGDGPGIEPLPSETSGHITFGSFNNLAKETPEVFELWSEILRRVPDSRLILKAKSFLDNETCNYVKDRFSLYGVDPARIELLARESSFSGHLGLYNRIDIGLDPFPYNGTTTTCEALWMGVPVVTLAGDVHASRVGKSILTNIGLPELVADTKEQYVEIAVRLTEDVSKLKNIRETMRDRLVHSKLFDAVRFTLNLETTLLWMWEEWCKEVRKL